MPGRYTAEGTQVAFPVPSHSSDCSASRAPPGLKPQTARVAGAGSVLPSTPRGRLPTPETRAPATGLGLQGKLTVVATGLCTQPARVLASVTRREPTKGVLCSRKRWRSPGRETIGSSVVAPWRAPQAADLGLRICSYGPGAPARPSVCRRAPSQGRVSLRRPRRGGRRAARRGREPGCGVSAGGRLASALGLCSASVAPPALRLREQTAPGHRAPGYKLRPGGGAYAVNCLPDVCEAPVPQSLT